MNEFTVASDSERKTIMYENFETALLSMKDRVQDLDFATDLYRALCNMRWQSKTEPENIYSCSWRYAGGLVANLRGQGEDYLDFYCSDREGTITDEVKHFFDASGWEPLPWKEE
jgi:hypothetical protein